MATCDYQELLSETPCFMGLEPFQLEVVKTVLLCRIYGGECDFQSLLDEANCLMAATDFSAFNIELIKTQLLCDITDGEVPDPEPPDPPGEPPIWNEDDPGEPPTFACSGEIVYLLGEYYFGLSQDQNPNVHLSGSQIDCMEEIIDIIVADYLASSGRVLIERGPNWWKFSAGVFNGKSGTAKSSSGICDPNNPFGDATVSFNGAYEIAAILCLEP